LSTDLRMLYIVSLLISNHIRYVFNGLWLWLVK